MPNLSEIKSRLAQYDEAYEAAEADVSYAQIPDGTHQAVISESRIEEQEWGLQWFLQFRNQHGSVAKWHNLEPENPDFLHYVKIDAQALGFDGSFSELPEWVAAEGPIGAVCEIRVKTKQKKSGDGTFTNVYINRVLGKADPDTWVESLGVPTGVTAAQGDDIPF